MDTPLAQTPPWTCPFCPLLCDSGRAVVDGVNDSLTLTGLACMRSREALKSYGTRRSHVLPLVNGVECDLTTAVDAAARALQASQQPLFGGLGTDVAGARALYRLAHEVGAITDVQGGAALMKGLRALQDRGAFTTTLAEVRTRADLIVCVGGSPTARLPELFRRCGVGEATVAQRHLVFLGGGADTEMTAQALGQLPGVTTEIVPLQDDLFTTASLLASAVARPGANNSFSALADRLRQATYAVLIVEMASLPAHGALIVETINHLVNTLNASTRAAMLPLGGGDGAATANQVFAWLSGLPVRTRLTHAGLEHEPFLFDTDRLLADQAADLLLWISSFRADAEPPARSSSMPRIVLGHPAQAAHCGGQSGLPNIFIPVATPGIGSAGHLFRTDGVVLMPLHAVVDQGLPSVADVIQRLHTALVALRPGATS